MSTPTAPGHRRATLLLLLQILGPVAAVALLLLAVSAVPDLR